jgi:hypothetical protein
VSLERGPLSLVSTIEELLERKSSDSGLEIEITAVEIRCTDYPQKLALILPTRGCRSVGMARSRTQATELFFVRLAATQAAKKTVPTRGSLGSISFPVM